MTRHPDPVVVVGAGVKAPGGLTPDELWASLCGARSFAEPFRDPRFPPHVEVVVARVAGLDAAAYLPPVQVRRFDRCHHLAVAAAHDALSGVAGPLPAPERCAVVCGVGLGANGYHEHQHEELLRHGLRALNPVTIPVFMSSSPAILPTLQFGFRGS